MKNRKYLWVVMVLALVGAMLTACGGGGRSEPEAPTAAPPTEAPAATPTPSAGDHVALGMEYYEQGELDKAVAEFEKALALDPDDAEAHRNLGTAYGEQGRWEEAAAAYEKAIELAPDFGEAYGDLAAAYFNLGKLAEAVAAGEKGIELDPNYAMAYNNLGVVYGAQGDLDRAITLLRQAIQVDSDCADAHYNLGFAYESLGQAEGAIAEYQEAIRADPDYTGAYENLGGVYARLGQLDEAIAWWKKTLEIEPDRASTHQNLGMAYAQQGKADEAIAAFETYLQLAPPDAPERAQVESWIAELEGAAADAGTKYSNAESGYSLSYPTGWYYVEDGARVSFAGSKKDYEAPALESPLVTLLVTPLAQAAQGFGLDESAAPTEFLQVMTGRVEAEVEEMDSIQIAGYPAAVAATSGTVMDSPYRGNMIIILVGERLFLAEAIAPPDQWDAFRPTFVDMINSLSFFEPSG
jgi:tetratricopeptide (TPR) repeat protein